MPIPTQTQHKESVPNNESLPIEQIHPEKQRRIGKESSSHGPIYQVALVHVDLVFFGRFEIRPWFPSPYVMDPLEYREATCSHSPHPPPHANPLTLKKNINSQTLVQNNHPNNSIMNPHQVSNRSQTPDSLSSIDTGSAPSDFPIHPHLSENLDPSQYLPPNSTSDLNPTGPSQLLLTPCSNNPINQSPSSSPFVKLYVCDGCLKYLLSLESFRQHKIHCKITHPPGRKVYQSGKIIIREIDGSKAKLYCQCLCLFGKLFIDHKYIFFDVEGFKFYVLTIQEERRALEGPSKGIKKETVMGFFSKEKISYDGYNLACIVTLPPYQKKGYGTLLIAFSYELDRFQGGSTDENGLPSEENLYLGTPERPLSTLGAKGYLSYWTSVLVRFFRTLFPPPPPRINHHHHQNPSIMIEMTLEEISRSTRLRPDDAAFALISSGLTKFKKNNKVVYPLHSHSSPLTSRSIINHQDDFYLQNNSNLHDQCFVITRDLVEQVALKAHVKSATLDPRHVLINHSNFDNLGNNHDHHQDENDHLTSEHHSFNSCDDDSMSHHLSST